MAGNTINDISERIRQKRKELGLTQEEVARKLGISLTAYRKIESGTTGLINKRAEELSRILNTTPEYLLLDIGEDGNNTLKENLAREFEEYKRQSQELRDNNATLIELIKSKDEIIRLLKEKLNENTEKQQQ